MKNMQKRPQNDSQFPRAGPAFRREAVAQPVARDLGKGGLGEGPEAIPQQ